MRESNLAGKNLFEDAQNSLSRLNRELNNASGPGWHVH